MIVAMQEKATEEQIDAVIDAMVEAGVNVHRQPARRKRFWPRRTDGRSGPQEV